MGPAKPYIGALVRAVKSNRSTRFGMVIGVSLHSMVIWR
jgi:hypothetical protein